MLSVLGDGTEKQAEGGLATEDAGNDRAANRNPALAGLVQVGILQNPMLTPKGVDIETSSPTPTQHSRNYDGVCIRVQFPFRV